MTAGAADGVRELRLTTPDDWWVLPLDAKTRHQAIARLVDERLGAAATEQVHVRNQLVAVLRRTARDAAEQGAVFCASMAGIEGDAGLSANVLVVIRPVAAVDPSAGPTTDLAALAQAMRDDPGPTAGGSPVDVSTVELPDAGPAVRVRSRRVARLDLLDREVPIVSVQYLVPLPDSSLTVLATFTSPALAYEDVLVELFDAIAGTLQLG